MPVSVLSGFLCLSGFIAGGRLVATCGGDSLCVMDCETGLVMKKYKVPGEVRNTSCITHLLS